MNELPQVKPPVLEHIQQFVNKTNDGRVFTLDTSTLDTSRSSIYKELTPEEIKERKEWEKTRSDLLKDYLALGRRYNLTVNDFLALRVAPPLLDHLWIPYRSTPLPDRERLYLDKIYIWEDFESEVRSFTEPAVEDGAEFLDILLLSLTAEGKVSNKKGERAFIHRIVLDVLRYAGLLKHGHRDDALALQKLPPIGNADIFLLAGGNKVVPIEFRGTHDLLVPEKAVDVIRRYNAVVDEVKCGNNRTIDWTNTGQPVAQVISNMSVGGSRYGVLCSGTRTYFFKVEETDDCPKVLITDAWFPGQPDFLRAWAYVFHVTKINGDFQPPDGWAEKWVTLMPVSIQDPNQPGRQEDTEVQGGADDSPAEPPPKSPKTDDQDPGPGGSATMQFMTWLDPGMAPSIPRVDGEEVAVKVFDFYKDWTLFESEISTYERLKGAWGVLVPEPYFIADWFGCVLLGMQLGRVPNSSDNEIEREQNILFRTLRRDYGFEHMDDHCGNVIYLPDKRGAGKDRLAAIDLEDTTNFVIKRFLL